MPDPSEISARKAQLRQRMIETRVRIPERVRRDAVREITALFLGNVPLKAWDIVGGYWPLAGEIDTRLLLETLSENGNKIALPVAEEHGRPLIFRQWKRGLDIKRNPQFKTLEPPLGVPELKPSVLIVPLLAFDAAGYRLGFGAGFYDRTISALAGKGNLFTVGLAFVKQQVGVIPREPHDLPLDCIITEKRVIVTAGEQA